MSGDWDILGQMISAFAGCLAGHIRADEDIGPYAEGVGEKAISIAPREIQRV